ncbi:MAG: hypothetical protein PHI35_06390 [Victivallaceae bacterium]|nr:hypothetical protein [Victivallaceae bacterium]
MNIQPGKIKQRTAVRRSSGSNIGTTVSRIGRLALLLLALAGVVNGYIYLNQKINETDTAINRCRVDIDRTGREIELARIRREELRAWPHIRSMMARYNIKLALPKSGQVSRMSILSVEQAANIPLRGITTASAAVGTVNGRN